MNTPPSPLPPNNKLQWKQVIISQDWASIFVNMFIVVALIVTSTVNDAADRSYLPYDATLANEYIPTSTIPFWLAIVFPLICMVISLAIYEFVSYKRQSPIISLTSVVSTALHFLIDFCFAAVVTSLLTEVSKLLVGRYRPDWLSRCQPDANSTQPFVPTWGVPPSQNPSCTSDIPLEKLEDGHKSFPSGHASNAFAMGVYISGYVMYCTYFRVGRSYFRTRKDGISLKQRVLRDMGTALSFLWILFNLSWAWGVAISRIIDNKHHPSDVVGGAFLGTIIGTAFVLRAVPRHFVVILEEEDDQRNYQQQHLLYDNAPGTVDARNINISRVDA